MADFNLAFKHTAQNEGAYANSSKDKGGETYMGISRNNWPNWKGWALIDSIKKQFVSSASTINMHAGSSPMIQTLVSEFYKANFWYPLTLQLLNDQQLATNVYDFGVNAGVGTAAKRLQRAANVNDDGKIGPATIRAVNSLPAKQVYDAFNAQRKAYYDNIIANNPSQAVWRKSWYSRIIPYKQA
jgi:lysozyme family protein